MAESESEAGRKMENGFEVGEIVIVNGWSNRPVVATVISSPTDTENFGWDIKEHVWVVRRGYTSDPTQYACDAVLRLSEILHDVQKEEGK